MECCIWQYSMYKTNLNNSHRKFKSTKQMSGDNKMYAYLSTPNHIVLTSL